jgi:F-type H+-transporting ATPase subunit gamma
MPSLKDLKNRIASVKSTRKITSAMKMVAASKLRRAQEQAIAARPYAQRMGNMLQASAKNLKITGKTPRLLAGTGRDNVVLLLVMTSDRGLCGGFNGNVVREARRQIRSLEGEGKQVKLYFVGRKGRDLLRRDHSDKIIGMLEASSKKQIGFSSADALTQEILKLFETDQFDVLRVVYNKFKSVMSQEVTLGQLIPLQGVIAEEGNDAPRRAPAKANDGEDADEVEDVEIEAAAEAKEDSEFEDESEYGFEPNEEEILAKLLPRNLATQIYATMLESLAGEHGARMTAMDSATRNAGDMIDKLTLNYNRSRQAFITKELIEIISGAEASA